MHIFTRTIIAISTASIVSTINWSASIALETSAWQKLEDAGTNAYKKKDFVQAESSLSAAVKEAEGTSAANLGTSLNDLGLVYEAQKKYDDAESSFKRSIEVKEKNSSPDSETLIPTLNNLALVYRETNKLDLAQSTYERSLKLTEKKYGPDHPADALILNSLAGIMIAANKPADAEQFLKKSLPIWEKAYGPKHPAVAKCLDNLGSVCESQNKMDEAHDYFKRALAIRSESTTNTGSPADRAISLNKMANLHRDKGEFEEAQPLLKEVVEITEKDGGAQTANMAIALNNLALVDRELGEFDQSEQLYRKVLDIRTAIGGSPEDLARSYDSLGDLYLQQEKYDQAEPAYKKALELREKAGGESGATVRISLSNLSNLARDKGNLPEALNYAKKSLDIAKKNDVPSNDISGDMTNLALLYREEGDQQHTGALFREAVDLGKQNSNLDPVVEANNLNNLARFYRENGNYADAEPLYKLSLTMREKALGPNSPQVGASLRNYAILLRKLNRDSEADVLDKRAEKIEDKTEIEINR